MTPCSLVNGWKVSVEHCASIFSVEGGGGILFRNFGPHLPDYRFSKCGSSQLELIGACGLFSAPSECISIPRKRAGCSWYFLRRRLVSCRWGLWCFWWTESVPTATKTRRRRSNRHSSWGPGYGCWGTQCALWSIWSPSSILENNDWSSQVSLELSSIEKTILFCNYTDHWLWPYINYMAVMTDIPVQKLQCIKTGLT